MSRFNFKKICFGFSDLIKCAGIMCNPFDSYGYLRTWKDKKIGKFKFSDLRFQGRREDWPGVREVLIDDEYSFIKQIIQPARELYILDLGANIGSFAIRFFSEYPLSQIASVEPAFDTFQILESNRKLNPRYKWHALNYAVWSKKLSLNILRKNISAGHRVVEGSGSETIQGVTLSCLLEILNWNHIDLIKMDIEGGEAEVVPFALDVFRITETLIIEIHTDRINAEPVLSALKKVYQYVWQLNDRTSSKPLLVLSNQKLDLKEGNCQANLFSNN